MLYCIIRQLNCIIVVISYTVIKALSNNRNMKTRYSHMPNLNLCLEGFTGLERHEGE